MSVTVRIEGGRELSRKLGLLQDAVAGNALLQAVNKGSDPVLREAERTYPRRGSTRVRKKVDRETVESSRHRAEVAIGPTKKAGTGGFFQEIGTRNHAARPWLRPSFDTTVDEAKATIERELRQRIELAARA